MNETLISAPTLSVLELLKSDMWSTVIPTEIIELIKSYILTDNPILRCIIMDCREKILCSCNNSSSEYMILVDSHKTWLECYLTSVNRFSDERRIIYTMSLLSMAHKFNYLNLYRIIRKDLLAKGLFKNITKGTYLKYILVFYHINLF